MYYATMQFDSLRKKITLIFLSLLLFIFSKYTYTRLKHSRASTIQLNTLYNSILSLIGRHLPRMALEMARTRVKFSLPYNSPKTWLLWKEEVVAMQDARREKVA